MLPCFQRFQLPAIHLLGASWQNTCFHFKQHGHLLRAWLLEGFILMAHKNVWIMFSLQTKWAIYLTKTPFQPNHKLHGIFINSFTHRIRHLWSFRCRNIRFIFSDLFTQRNVLKTSHVCVSLWRKILLTLFGDHIFHLRTEKNSVNSWCLPKKVNFGPRSNECNPKVWRIKILKDLFKNERNWPVLSSLHILVSSSLFQSSFFAQLLDFVPGFSWSPLLLLQFLSVSYHWAKKFVPLKNWKWYFILKSL